MSRNKGKEEEIYPDALFLKNEKVLCYHGAMIYEGKVLAVQKETVINEGDDPFMYYIHYAGWNKKWDEYVPESRVLKHNAENLELKDKTNKKTKVEPDDKTTPASRKRPKTSTGKGSAGPPNKKFAPSEQPVVSDEPAELDTGINEVPQPLEKEATLEDADKLQEVEIMEEVNLPPAEIHTDVKPDFILVKIRPESGDGHTIVDVEDEISVSKEKIVASQNLNVDTECVIDVTEVQKLLPDKVRAFLLDDYNRAKLHNRLLNIPARLSIEQLLQEFLDRVSDSYSKSELRQFEEFTKQMAYTFQRAMSARTSLVHVVERDQYDELCKSIMEIENTDPETIEKSFTAMFGATHLLRFCGCFGELTNKYRGDVKSLKEQLKFFYDRMDDADFFDEALDYMAREDVLEECEEEA